MQMRELNSLLQSGYTWEEAWDALESAAEDAYDYSRDDEPDFFDDVE